VSDQKDRKRGIEFGRKVFIWQKNGQSWIADIKIDLFEYTMMEWAGVGRWL
jgi:hypothetical protein